MNFSTSLFVLYFLPGFLIIYFLLGSRLRKTGLLVASFAFFFWGAPVFAVLVLVSALMDYHLAGAMAAGTGKARKTILVFLVVTNLAALFYFKYTGFFIHNMNQLFGVLKLPEIPGINVLLPLGISFIVFQKISYLVDVFRGTTAPSARFKDYALFIFFFPKLLAGPIVKYKDFYPDNGVLEKSSFEYRITGFFRFALGLAKKVIIANALGVFVDEIFATEIRFLNSPTAWLGALAYTFQIYFDFSAYSDMAIGLARMLGFNITENFNNPYISRSVTEFWKRWHITLGTWLRDYLFLPVAYAVSRRLPAERYFGIKTDRWIYVAATLVTMILCGFWHGAGWTFVFWGLYLGLLMSIERLFLVKAMKKAGAIPSVALTFMAIVLGWVIFRAPSFTYGLNFISLMFSFKTGFVDFIPTQQLYVLLGISAFFSFWAMWGRIEKWQMHLYTGIRSTAGLVLITVSAFVFFVFGLSQVTASGFNPFIYFRF